MDDQEEERIFSELEPTGKKPPQSCVIGPKIRVCPFEMLRTDLLVGILRGKNDAKEKIEQFASEGKQATTAINASNSSMARTDRQELRRPQGRTDSALSRLQRSPSRNNLWQRVPAISSLILRRREPC